MKKSPKSSKKQLSQAELADVLGVTPQVISYHRKSGKAPKLDDVVGWEVFLASVERGGSGGGTPEVRAAIAEQRLRVVTETAVKLARENAVASGELIALAEVRRSALDAASWYWNALERLLREGPRLLLGLDSTQLRDALARKIHEIREGSRERFNQVAGEPYVRKPYTATRQRYTGPGWLRGPSCNQTAQLDAIVARTGCQYPESEKEMDAMLAADDATKGAAK